MAKKDFSRDAADIFNLKQRQDEEKKTSEVKTQQESLTKRYENEFPENKKAKDESKMTSKTFRITEKQHKALKIRSAQSDDPSEKDISAIVRKALDTYLTENNK